MRLPHYQSDAWALNDYRLLVRRHCDVCGSTWFSNDGTCHLCRQGYSCACDDPAGHVARGPGLATVVVLGLMGAVLAVLVLWFLLA